MKRLILVGLPALLILGHAASSNAFLFPLFTPITNRPSVPKLDERLLDSRNGDENLTRSSSTKSLVLKWCEQYRQLCETKPLPTKALSQSMIGGLGSILSQSALAKSSALPIHIDWGQVLAFMVSGLLFEGPYFHWWFGRLEALGKWLERNSSVRPATRSTVQVLVDQTIGVLLFFPTFFFVYEVIQAFLHLKVPDLILASHRLQSEFLVVIRTNYFIWPLANWIIFRFVPESLRVLATSLIAVLWNAFLCSRVAGVLFA